MRVLVVMDPIETVNLKKIPPWPCYGQQAVADMNWVMHYNTIYISIKVKPLVLISPLKVFEDYDHYFELGEQQKESLADYDVILMRKDSTIRHELCLHHLYLGNKRNVKARGLSINHSPYVTVMRKLFATQFPELQVPTLVTSQQSLIREFIKEHGDVIVKPLDGMAAWNFPFISRWCEHWLNFGNVDGNGHTSDYGAALYS